MFSRKTYTTARVCLLVSLLLLLPCAADVLAALGDLRYSPDDAWMSQAVAGADEKLRAADAPVSESS